MCKYSCEGEGIIKITKQLRLRHDQAAGPENRCYSGPKTSSAPRVADQGVRESLWEKWYCWEQPELTLDNYTVVLWP